MMKIQNCSTVDAFESTLVGDVHAAADANTKIEGNSRSSSFFNFIEIAQCALLFEKQFGCFVFRFTSFEKKS